MTQTLTPPRTQMRRKGYKPPTRGQIELMNAVNQEAAEKLTTVGMEVVVTKDDGSTLVTKLVHLPWKLGHGTWVCKVEGISGGYDCARVTPALRP